MLLKMCLATGRNVELVDTLSKVLFRGRSITAGDGDGLGRGRIGQEPISGKLMNNLTSLVYLEGTQPLNSLEVLGVEGSKTGTVEMLVQDTVTLTQIDVVDHVAAHEIGVRELSGVPGEAGGDGEDVVLRNGDERVILGKRKRKGVKPEESE